MRTLLRRVIRWALAPTEAEQRAMGMLPGETTAAWLARKREAARMILPTLSQKCAEGRNAP